VSDRLDGFSPEVEVLPMPAAARALSEIKTPEADFFPSSYRRLWSLSLEAAGILGEWILSLDVDCMVVDYLRPLLRFDHDFIGWTLPGWRPETPTRFGGGTWLHRTGTRTWVYDRFVADPAKAIDEARAAGYRGSDQAWLSYCLEPTEARWPEPSGIYTAQGYRATGRRPNGLRQLPTRVPKGAIILHVNGTQKPWHKEDEVTRVHWRPFHAQVKGRFA